MDLEMTEEEAAKKLEETTEAEEITDVTDEDAAFVQEKLKGLFGDKSHIYKHFIQGGGPKSPKKTKGGRMKKGRMTEEEEDKQLLAGAEAEKSSKMIDRLDKQPSMLVGTTLRSYQLEGEDPSRKD